MRNSTVLGDVDICMDIYIGITVIKVILVLNIYYLKKYYLSINYMNSINKMLNEAIIKTAKKCADEGKDKGSTDEMQVLHLESLAELFKKINKYFCSLSS